MNPESLKKYRIYQKIYQKKYRKTHKEELKIYWRNYQQTHKKEMSNLVKIWQRKNPDKVYDFFKRWRIKNPLKNKARTMVNNALYAGKIKKSPCAVCGNNKVVAHHEDYSKPLEVIWLCKKHHLELHNKNSYD